MVALQVLLVDVIKGMKSGICFKKKLFNLEKIPVYMFYLGEL
jgi:hypothetical protein